MCDCWRSVIAGILPPGLNSHDATADAKSPRKNLAAGAGEGQDVGYEYRPDESVPGRLFFAKGPRSNRTHHLSLSEPGSTFYKEKLLFRDYLRSHADAAEEYRGLKEGLADRYAANRALYTEGKKAFV